MMRTLAGVVQRTNPKVRLYYFVLQSAVSGDGFDFQFRNPDAHAGWVKAVERSRDKGSPIVVHYTMADGLRWVEDIVE
jgi:hypothetical protein